MASAKYVAPSQARGLKRGWSAPALSRLWGRAFTGAWVETLDGAKRMEMSEVAPSQARGLKLGQVDFYRRHAPGRAFTGAWVETGEIVANVMNGGTSRLHRRVG